MKATIWHNPRCSKSREALARLQAAGAEVTVVDYLSHPPAAAVLARLVAAAGLSPRDALRAEAQPLFAFAAPETILAAIAADPALLERPFVETERGVRLARPPDRVAEIL
jgi:arsenate reductase (glutaredoxin)